MIIACPSHGADAAKMLRECVRLAREEQRLVVFIEPIALYLMRDLHDAKDGAWMHHYPAPDERIEIGQAHVTGHASSVSYPHMTLPCHYSVQRYRRAHTIKQQKRSASTR